MINQRANIRVNSPAAIAARLLLERAQIAHADYDKSTMLVDERFIFTPDTRYWRSIDGAHQGYTLSKLIDFIKNEQPVEVGAA